MTASDPEYSKKYYQKHKEYLKGKAREARARLTVSQELWRGASRRSRDFKLEFNIEVSDIIVPNLCPILDIKLFKNPTGRGHHQNSPTLDRIDNTKGYVKGNIAVISYKANSCKSDLSTSQLKKLYEYSKVYND